MKKVFIKYNPYRLLTEVQVDGNALPENSCLHELICREDQRLQDLMTDLLRMLADEYREKDFEITFHGTQPDFEDLADALADAEEQGLLKASLQHVPAKETAGKAALIDKVFKEITSDACPFKELKDPKIVATFNAAKSKDFEICVVATMSSGKSTLINAMLGTKLMPSKQEACTAIITRIKDNDEDHFRAEVFRQDNDTEGAPSEIYEHVDYQLMKRLNDDPEVSLINMEGDIPFLPADKEALVLVDTPGPNNARDASHRTAQREFLGSSSQALVLYIMTAEFFGSDDDDSLLKQIASSMEAEGRKSRDRFIFVVNKMDNLKREDGSADAVLGKVRAYLESHGIANPNLFPVAALPAMEIRRMKSGELDDEDEIDEAEIMIRKLNRSEMCHFENYAVLPPSIREEINGQIEKAEANWQGDSRDNPDTALIHSGIVSLEATISQYVLKYAKTTKFKQIVDTFMHKLEEQRYAENLKKELVSNKAEQERLLEQIAEISKKIDSVKEVKRFQDTVNSAVMSVYADTKDIVDSIVSKFKGRLNERIAEFEGEELDLFEADFELKMLAKFAKRQEQEFRSELSGMVHSKLIGASEAMSSEYRKKLSLLPEAGSVKILIDPLRLVGGSVVSERFDALKQAGTSVARLEGKEWNDDDSWRAQFKNVSSIKGDVLAHVFFASLQQAFDEQGDAACQYAQEQCGNIVHSFEKEFMALDDLLKARLKDLKTYAVDCGNVEERIREVEARQQWLDSITEKVNSILDI